MLTTPLPIPNDVLNRVAVLANKSSGNPEPLEFFDRDRNLMLDEPCLDPNNESQDPEPEVPDDNVDINDAPDIIPPYDDELYNDKEDMSILQERMTDPNDSDSDDDNNDNDGGPPPADEQELIWDINNEDRDDDLAGNFANDTSPSDVDADASSTKTAGAGGAEAGGASM